MTIRTAKHWGYQLQENTNKIDQSRGQGYEEH